MQVSAESAEPNAYVEVANDAVVRGEDRPRVRVVGGIGGCPFAPAATGNIATDDLLYMLDRSGVETGVSLQKVMDISHWLETQLGRGIPALLPKAGAFPAGQSM